MMVKKKVKDTGNFEKKKERKKKKRRRKKKKKRQKENGLTSSRKIKRTLAMLDTN
ncbi:hypothetical protein OFC04_24915 [Escherichia coli]|nr:hypothetical protein [Escherichia coli]